MVQRWRLVGGSDVAALENPGLGAPRVATEAAGLERDEAAVEAGLLEARARVEDLEAELDEARREPGGDGAEDSSTTGDAEQRLRYELEAALER